MRVFKSRHNFALWCLTQIVKDDLLRWYMKEFKEVSSKKDFVFDDFVIRFYSYYFLNNRLRYPEDAVL